MLHPAVPLQHAACAWPLACTSALIALHCAAALLQSCCVAQELCCAAELREPRNQVIVRQLYACARASSNPCCGQGPLCGSFKIARKLLITGLCRHFGVGTCVGGCPKGASVMSPKALLAACLCAQIHKLLHSQDMQQRQAAKLAATPPPLQQQQQQQGLGEQGQDSGSVAGEFEGEELHESGRMRRSFGMQGDEVVGAFAVSVLLAEGLSTCIACTCWAVVAWWVTLLRAYNARFHTLPTCLLHAYNARFMLCQPLISGTAACQGFAGGKRWYGCAPSAVSCVSNNVHTCSQAQQQKTSKRAVMAIRKYLRCDCFCTSQVPQVSSPRARGLQ